MQRSEYYVRYYNDEMLYTTREFLCKVDFECYADVVDGMRKVLGKTDFQSLYRSGFEFDFVSIASTSYLVKVLRSHEKILLPNE